jgi:glycosyltransferase involved in cell wall biosynthesis
VSRVSIQLITWRHQAYLAEAIDGVLAQDFEDWELIIGEDGSDDRTLDIARDYESRHKDRIRVLTHDHPADKGKTMYLRSLSECRAEYVACLDGDDVWCSPDKLSRQINVLDQQPELSACVHNMKVIKNGRETGVIGGKRERRYFEKDIIRGVHLSRSSAMFRGQLERDFPASYSDPRLFNGDVLHFLLAARRGPIAYLPDALGAYRLHDSSDWNSRDQTTRIELNTGTRQVILEAFPGDYDQEIRRYENLHSAMLIPLYVLRGRFGSALDSLKRCFRI